MKEKIGDKARLLHMIDAIAQIKGYVADKDFESFSANKMMLFACIKQLEIIGEASNHLTEQLKEQYAEVRWKDIIGLRHILVHQYFEINTKLVWNIITSDLPILDAQIQAILSSL